MQPEWKSLLIFGTRGIPARHGGFETFAQDLSLYLTGKGWAVTVYCQSEQANCDIHETEYQSVRLVHISPCIGKKVLVGALGTALFDLRCIIHAIRHKKDGVWLTLGYNTGILSVIPKLLGKRHVMNMDGIEWKRSKWSVLHKIAFRINYFFACLFTDYLIADHPAIADMLKKDFPWKETNIETIAYGSRALMNVSDHAVRDLDLVPNDYVLVVARPEPENNIHMIVKAWSVQNRPYKLVILGHYDPAIPFHQIILRYASDNIIFPGKLHDPDTIDSLRYHAKAYVHGHSVGGTNPSLVEALGAGNAIIAHDNPFNRYVAGDAGYYFSTKKDLKIIFDRLCANTLELDSKKQAARTIHERHYQQEHVLQQYMDFLEKISA